MIQYILDTSALFTYIENEEGAIEIEALLQSALADEVVLYISIVSCIEVFYITWQEQGKEVANERLRLIDDLMVIQEPVDSQHGQRSHHHTGEAVAGCFGSTCQDTGKMKPVRLLLDCIRRLYPGTTPGR